MNLTDNNYRNLVIKQAGPVLVYFSQSYGELNLIRTEFETLFDENNDIVKFGQYQANGSGGAAKYQVSKFPALNYYYDGILVDQLATVPKDVASQIDLKKDITLWFYETVLANPDEEKQFHYIFNGGNKLSFHPY